MEQRADDDHFVLEIDEKLGNLSPIPLERSLFRVHDALRNINVKAYEPQVIAIGPYHHAKDEKKAHLRPMEEHKLLYLKKLLERRNETSARRYIVALQQSEKRARKFYAEPISLSSNEFVEMMLLDGCFIIEFLRMYEMRSHSHLKKRNDPILPLSHIPPSLRRDLWLFENQYYQRIDNDPIFQLSHIPPDLRRDLQLFENQLPLFILVQLFNMTKLEESENIINRALNFFGNIVQPGQHTTFGNIEELPHLLSLVHNCCCYPFKLESLSQRNKNHEVKNAMFIESATKLMEAGVKFNKAKGQRDLFDISFQNGTMTIPTLVVDDDTDCLFRNYIVYEQYVPDDYPKYFTNYMHFIDCLVSSSKDVEILRDLGIVDNLLGDDEVVSSMVNKLGDNVNVDFDSFDKCYSKVFNDVNKHCKQRINKWLAKLRRDYFNSPWAFISFAAAFVLLLLTVAQTVFSILSIV